MLAKDQFQNGSFKDFETKEEQPAGKHEVVA